MKEPRIYMSLFIISWDLAARGRPVLTLMTAEILRQIIKKALPAALAVEVFIIFVGTR
jgi:hypothetical protein